ncbi:hypothetical protein [Microbacterium arborescens]|nr:hypothetical protein [Microbacterium arborescens]
MQTPADRFFARKRTAYRIERLMGERVVNAQLELIAFYARGFDKRYNAAKRERNASIRARYPQFTRRPDIEVVRVLIAAELPPRHTGPKVTPHRRAENRRTADAFFAGTRQRRAQARANITAWIERERQGYARHITVQAHDAPLDPVTAEELAALAPRSDKPRRIKRGQIVVVGMTEEQALAIANAVAGARETT